MKAFVIVALSLAILHSFGDIARTIKEEDNDAEGIGKLIGGIIRLAVMVLGLIFTCVGW